MGLANWLTVLRILLIPVFVSLLVYRKPGLALVVFVAAALTDLLDGYVARRQGLSSRLGAFLDPMADKLLLVSSFVTLTWLKALPFWIAAVVISRIYPRPTRAGKIATFFQVLTVLTGLASRFVHVGGGLRAVMWLAAAFTLISGLQYIVQGMRFLNAAHAAEREADEASLLG